MTKARERSTAMGRAISALFKTIFRIFSLILAQIEDLMILFEYKIK